MTHKPARPAAPASGLKREPPLSSWDHRIITVALSQRRRKALREFALSIEPELSKAEALYELIDRALPIRTGPAPNPEAEEARAIASRSAQALETVAAALAPLLSTDCSLLDAAEEAAGAALSSKLRAQASGAASPLIAPSPASPLPPRAWLEGALKRLALGASNVELVMKCNSAQLAAAQPILVFEVERIIIDGRSRYRGNVRLPLIAIPLRIRINDPDLGIRGLMAGASLLDFASNDGWDCRLAQSADSAAPPLLSFKC